MFSLAPGQEGAQGNCGRLRVSHRAFPCNPQRPSRALPSQALAKKRAGAQRTQTRPDTFLSPLIFSPYDSNTINAKTPCKVATHPLQLRLFAMTTYGLGTVLRPDPPEEDYQPDEDREIIEYVLVPTRQPQANKDHSVIVVHGLSNFHEDIWQSKDEARSLMRSLFGWRDFNLRLSVYRYRPIVSPASVLVSHGIRQEASRLLKAVAELKGTNTKVRDVSRNP